MEALRENHPELFGEGGALRGMAQIERGPFFDGTGRLPSPLRPDPEGPLLGVQVQTKEGGDLEVMSVVPDSLAEKLGIRTGDILLSVNGQKISEVRDVRLGLQRKTDGTTRVTVRRNDEDTQLETDARPTAKPLRPKKNG